MHIFNRRLKRGHVVLVAAALFIISLCAPVEGRWFTGMSMVGFSMFGAVLVAKGLDVQQLTVTSIFFSVVLVLLPLYNFLIVYALVRLRRASFQPSVFLKRLLAATALHAVSFSGIFTVAKGVWSDRPGSIVLLAIWCLSLVTLACAGWMRGDGKPAATGKGRHRWLT